MSTYTATIRWVRNGEVFTDMMYQRAHDWEFDGGAIVHASASPNHVPEPCSDPAGVDPEEAFVVSVSSCHMLFFLSIAARRGYVVNSYSDSAAAVSGKNEAGQLAIVSITLRPNVRFRKGVLPSRSEFDSMHEEAHHKCFIANSIKTAIKIESNCETDEK